MLEPIPDFNSRGTPVSIGKCPVCGTKMYRMGRSEKHEGLEPPKIIKKPPKRSGKLVIVESPAKARTVGNILGKEYRVKASVGHVRDLLRSQLSVDVENNFKPKYRIPNEKRSIVKELIKDGKKAEEIFLATDPDREGEAIAWHLLESAEFEVDRVKRIVFHEITKPAISEAFSNPREIDQDLVDAQQARRILDRLVGYNLTPLLWKKVRGRLSAGRVQSVALRLIIEREREIEDFNPEEYWSLNAEFSSETSKDQFKASLVKINGEDPDISSKEEIDELVSILEGLPYQVSSIKRGSRKRNPYPPFITSTLQQQASRQLGFTAKRTMQIAQQLYEGIDDGNGSESGLITYMRTDSTNISPVAINEVRDYIQNVHGSDFLPEKPNYYKTRAKKAQEAHEALRPTLVDRTPEKIKQYLNNNQYKLYRLIWRRFVASQMKPALYETQSIEVHGLKDSSQYLFRASGSTIKFPGFLVLYDEATDNGKKGNGDKELKIPEGLRKGDPLNLLSLIPDQHFTQPPPRYSEASLVQTLEENGIGRPSTYAPIISTIQSRGYVYREAKRLHPTEIGFIVNDLLVEYFPDILGIHFTAHMEEDLDEVASGARHWNDVIADFYHSFEPRLTHAQNEIPENQMEPEKIGRDCPKCGNELVIKWGRFGKFISCSNYPECRYTEPYLEKINIPCPKDNGELVLRKTRKGRIFYGCSNYPECDFSSWKRPLPTPCPNCSGLLVVKNKREAQCLDCEEEFLQASLETEKTA